ncbi:MAG: hypothetical protein IKZ39_06085, partial [Lachnospiraceae bacterium]|nr:hypothetical protein [Lachnospiraceae bacterium]
MAVFLKILAIIGIVLLSILGIILLAVLLVLFVPVRYKAEGSFKDNKPKLVAGGSWLLHIVSVRYTLGEADPLCIRVFGFKIKSKKEAEPDFEEDDDELPTSLPTIQCVKSGTDVSDAGVFLTIYPSRMTTTLSQTDRISWSRCVMKITAMPFFDMARMDSRS